MTLNSSVVKGTGLLKQDSIEIDQVQFVMTYVYYIMNNLLSL